MTVALNEKTKRNSGLVDFRPIQSCTRHDEDVDGLVLQDRRGMKAARQMRVIWRWRWKR